MRIGIDIDSTLHDYWHQLSGVARERFGVDLAYEHQHGWGIDGLTRDQLATCVRETHGSELVASATPYPGAVDAVRAWHEAGHFIHVTSHRDPASHDRTERWLRAVGMAFDELRCDFDKVSHCRRIGIDLLVDDSPVNLTHAREAGIAVATIRHPWNASLCHNGDVVWGDDWAELARRLAPLLIRHAVEGQGLGLGDLTDSER